MRLTFLGAAQQVTGSCFLFEVQGRQFLVDCGMFQGSRAVEQLNRRPFGFDPARLDCVILTHAHIDHSGLLPRLSAQGFSGPVLTTQATCDLLGVMLPDSAWLQKMEFERAQRHRRKVPPPLYSLEDVEQLLSQCRALPYDEVEEFHPGLRVCLREAGHILGSAVVELWLGSGQHQRKVVISGDLGQPGRPILRDAAVITEADVLLLESTYGDRNHRSLPETLDEFVETIHSTLFKKGGNLVVPSFAVGRTQEILYWFNQLAREGRLPAGLRIYVDSPMANEVTRLTARHAELFDEETKQLVSLAPRADWAPVIRLVSTVEESMSLNRLSGGAVIIAASGMCEGGRIRHHLRHNIGNPRSTIMITGFQAQGTLGRRLVDGAKRIRLFGESLAVRAKLVTIGGFSAHADQQALVDWAAGFSEAPGRVALVHGELQAQQSLAAAIEQRLGWNCDIPGPGTVLDLEAIP